ncbi:glycine zipper 2TM domain-containing protein [Massilia sp. METH4]|uniref:glycine zipper 2TM domain-containing protein n=1 Tax=Massilia sp. METH4 TaxID=3123041 RepID=UPI0030D47095
MKAFLRSTLATLALSTLMAGAHADPHHKHRVCNDCGKVTGVRVVEKDGKGGATGVIVGGVAGGLLGNQIGSGTGRDLATVAGAVGGAYAGKHIEGKMKKVKTWIVNVRFENGRTRSYDFANDPHMHKGDRVRRNGDRIVRG